MFSPALLSRLTGGGNPPTPPAAPQNYKPSTADERNRWNKFLDFLATKGVGGSPDLDKRDRTRGLDLMKEYNKTNPTSQVNPEFITRAQYESHLIRKQKTFPGLKPDEAKYAFEKLAPQYLNRDISPVDNWLGSYTSKQYYPTFERLSKNGKQAFGTDFETYVRSVPK